MSIAPGTVWYRFATSAVSSLLVIEAMLDRDLEDTESNARST